MVLTSKLFPGVSLNNIMSDQMQNKWCRVLFLPVAFLKTFKSCSLVNMFFSKIGIKIRKAFEVVLSIFLDC